MLFKCICADEIFISDENKNYSLFIINTNKGKGKQHGVRFNNNFRKKKINQKNVLCLKKSNNQII